MEVSEEGGLTIDDFIVPQKVEAFCNAYTPAPVQGRVGADIVFDDARLRRFFAAYVLPGIGDPLICYLDRLSKRGFNLTVTDDDELAIVVTKRQHQLIPYQSLSLRKEQDDDLY